MQRYEKMQKVFDYYVNRWSVEASALMFLNKGVRILPEHTPRKLGLDDRDQIILLLHCGCGKNNIKPPTNDDEAISIVVCDEVRRTTIEIADRTFDSVVQV
jgi:hypothetical protein